MTETTITDMRPERDPSQVKWVLDEYLLSRPRLESVPRLDEALAGIGCETFVTPLARGVQVRDDLPEWEGGCVVAYGSVPFVRQVTRSRAGSWQPGSFMRVENLSYTAFSAHLGDLMLNDDFVVLPYGEFLRRGLDPWGGSAFLRPDAVTKSFTGLVVRAGDFGHETNALERLSCVMPGDQVVVAREREIAGEFRFVIAGGEVAAGCCYAWDGVLDIRQDVHPACLELAREVAAREWQADAAYTCDVALERLAGGAVRARLLELNAFSCSGLYACDTAAVARHVSLAALREWAMD